LLQLADELLHLRGVVGVGHRAARQSETKRRIWHVSTVRAPAV